MKKRSSVILSRWTWGSGDQTEIIDVNLSDPISRITINAELVNSSYTAVDHPAKAIKSIELVDGSDVLFSMDGGAAQGTSFYGTGHQPFCLNNFIDNDSARIVYPLDFGRFLWDPVFCLDPTRYRNLQLKLGIDRSLGACSPDGAFLTVVGDVFDEMPAGRRGFLVSREVYQYAPTDANIEYIDLPLDLPYRMVVIKACAEEEGAIVQAEELKLSEDHDKRILIDERAEQYVERVHSQYRDWIEYIGVRGLTGGNSYYITPTHNAQAIGIIDTYADEYAMLPWAGGQLRKAYESGGSNINCYCFGQCPNGCIPILFGDRNNPDDMYDPTPLHSLRLQLTSRNAADGGVCDQTDSYTKIIVQQVRS